MAARRLIKMASQEEPTSSQGNNNSYVKEVPRITKENLYMVLALWMEDFPVERVEADPYKRVGAALALPNDMIYAVDCTRNGVHGVARLLMAHQDILEDCQVYVSRKPCSFCTKLLVQSKVKKVLYLPIEPEYKRQTQDNESEDEVSKKFENETSCVDNQFKVSAIGQKVFVPKVGQEVLAHAGEKTSTSSTMEETKEEHIKEHKEEEHVKTYWNEEWMNGAKEGLPWPAFDEKMKKQVEDDFSDIVEWMARIQIDPEKSSAFKAVSRNENQTITERNDPSEKPFDPAGNELERQQAYHLLTLAKFLAKRTDDPRKGVGAVIINKEKDIVALGWNGFPTKALFGEFPRASDSDEAVEKKKYPYIIHAEQNALLLRNTKNIEGGTLLVTKTPCNECTPLLEMQKIKTVVLGGKMQDEKKESLDYQKFCEKVREGVFCCFEMDPADDPSSKPPTQ